MIIIIPFFFLNKILNKKGILLLTKGQIDKAFNIFKAIIESPDNANNIPALLGKVFINRFFSIIIYNFNLLIYIYII